MKSSYKENDVLYWSECKNVISEILTVVTVKTMLPVVAPINPGQDCSNIDSYNARVSMYNGGVRAMADKIIDFMKSLDEKTEKDGDSDGDES